MDNDPFAWLDLFKQHPRWGQFGQTVASALPRLQMPTLPGINFPGIPNPYGKQEGNVAPFPVLGQQGQQGYGNRPQTQNRPNAIEPPGILNPPGQNKPPGSTGGTGKPKSTGNGNAGGAPPSTNPNPTGGVYSPKPTGATNRTAFTPVIFPGVETSNGRWAKYQDGSFVDYASASWQKAIGIQVADPQQKQLWDALPDSWKADIAGWDPSFRDAWLKAMSNPHMEGTFQGQRMSGQEAAKRIEDMAKDARSNNEKAAAMNAPQMQGDAFQPRAYYVNR